MSQIKVVEDIKTHTVQKLIIENRAFNEIMWKNIVDSDGPQMAV